MGNLVFQAASGGQVALSGPNTASSFTIAVPAVTGTLVTTGDTGTVSNTMLATGTFSNITGVGTITTGVWNGTTIAAGYGGTGLTSFTANGVVYASSTSALATGSALTFDGNKLVTNALSFNYYTGAYTLDGTISNYASSNSLYVNGNAGGYLTLQGAGNQKQQIGINGSNSGGEIFFQTNGLERARFDSSGNLGLGVTPSAWGSPFSSVMQFTKGSIACQSNSVILFNNAYYNGSSYRYVNTAGAGYYEQTGGQHIWNTAPSGTAGNAISFTQAMTLDASGNLGLGATTLNLIGGTRCITLNAPTGGNYSTIELATGGTLQGYLSSNNGSTSLGTNTSTPLLFQTNATERARIDSSGNLLVGTTITSQLLLGGFNVIYNGGSTYQCVGHISGTGSGTSYQLYSYNGTVIGSVSQSGTTAVLYNITSDQRLKENIVDAPEFGSIIDSLQVRSFDWKTDQTHQRAGFVAQELVTVAPEAVHQPIDPEEMMAVDYSKLVPMLVKEIQSLRKRILTLENK